jgi:uncharacterized membrane protein SpoIIM required for sporulation
MKQAIFEKQHQNSWQAFAKDVQALHKGQIASGQVKNFSQDYRRMCQHLAIAQQRGYSQPLLEYLELLVLQGHQQFYRHKSPLLSQFLAFIVIDFPATVRQQWLSIAIAQLAKMENMYDPAQRQIGPMSLRNHQDDWAMFGFYIMNNIGIAFQTFASGLILGLGSVFFLLFNGLHIGAIAGHLTQLGYSATFWPFVIGHGAFELTAIVIAGAAGLKLGLALIAPGPLSRATALRRAARTSIKLMGGVIIFLVLAAFIEAYWSSSSSTSIFTKVLVGSGLWALMLSYLVFSGRGRYAPH